MHRFLVVEHGHIIRYGPPTVRLRMSDSTLAQHKYSIGVVTILTHLYLLGQASL